MQLSDYDLRGLEQWSSVIFPQVYATSSWQSLLGYLCITTTEHAGFEDRLKLPGGQKPLPEDGVYDQTPAETAAREFREECGISDVSLKYMGKWITPNRDDYGSHWKCLFATNITMDQATGVHRKHRGPDGEVPQFLSTNSFRMHVREGRFNRGHYQMLVESKLINPVKRPAILRNTS